MRARARSGSRAGWLNACIWPRPSGWSPFTKPLLQPLRLEPDSIRRNQGLVRLATVLSILVLTAPLTAGAAVQNPPRTLEELLRQQVAPPGSHVNDPVVETDPLTAADRDYDNKVLGAFQ